MIKKSTGTKVPVLKPVKTTVSGMKDTAERARRPRRRIWSTGHWRGHPRARGPKPPTFVAHGVVVHGARAGLQQQFCTVRLAYQAFPLAPAHFTESAAFTYVVHGGDRQTSGGCAGQMPTGPGARRRSPQTGPSSVLCFVSRLSGTRASHRPALLAQARAATTLLGTSRGRWAPADSGNPRRCRAAPGVAV